MCFIIIKPHYQYTLIDAIDGMECRLKKLDVYELGVVLNTTNNNQVLFLGFKFMDEHVQGWKH